MEFKRFPEFTSYMTRGDYIKAFIWLPVHMVLLPMLSWQLMDMGYISESMANFLVYTVGVVFMLLFLGKFLRREFDPFCDRPMFCISEVCGSYLAMLLLNMAINSLFLMILPESNPNNSAIKAMADLDFGTVTAMAVCLAPIVEEVIFRGAVFGLARKRSRALAYILSALLFSLYHVWGYAVENPIYFVYILQYLPVSLLLCRCYERTNSLWTSIFFHMMVNAMSMSAMEALM